MVDRVQITRRDDSIPRWQIRDLKVSTSQLRYAPRASEEQIQEAVKLKPVTRSSDKGAVTDETYPLKDGPLQNASLQFLGYVSSVTPVRRATCCFPNRGVEYSCW